MIPGVAKVAAFFVGAACLFPLQASIDAIRPKRPSSFLYTPDRRLMKVIACGHGLTLADLVWVQSTDYVITEFTSGKTHIQHLYNLYDVITDLDPNYVDAYVMGSTFLSAVAEEPERALELLEKGQGELYDDGTTVTELPSSPGKVHREHKDRWKLLNETAGTHLVSLAGFAPTLEERQAEIRAGGRLYLFADRRYPYAVWSKRNPDFPDWFQEMGRKLTRSQAEAKSRYAWYHAVETVWKQREYFAAPGSPMKKLCERRLSEIYTLNAKDLLEGALAAYTRTHGSPPRALADLVGPPPLMKEIPKDGLEGGFFLVDGAIVAPALDAERLQREYTRRIVAFHSRAGRWPTSIAELEASFAGSALALPPAPRWVKVTYDADSGEVTTAADRGALVHPDGPR